MDNVTIVTLKNGKIQVTFDPTQDLGPSSSGKTTLVAKTGGAKDVPGQPGLKLNLTAYRK
jgi:hypothetical protein